MIDTPITEHGSGAWRVGAAMAAFAPIVEFMTKLRDLGRDDQIITSAAKAPGMSGGQIKAPIVFRGPNGAAVAAQHSQGLFGSGTPRVPGLTVIALTDAAA